MPEGWSTGYKRRPHAAGRTGLPRPKCVFGQAPVTTTNHCATPNLSPPLSHYTVRVPSQVSVSIQVGPRLACSPTGSAWGWYVCEKPGVSGLEFST
eukprot:1288728-Pyramimonas_sp.AAC.1